MMASLAIIITIEALVRAKVGSMIRAAVMAAVRSADEAAIQVAANSRNRVVDKSAIVARIRVAVMVTVWC